MTVTVLKPKGEWFEETCTKTMKIGSAVAFRQGVTYTWRWPTPEEEKKHHCDYVFRSELTPRHYLNFDAVREFFC